MNNRTKLLLFSTILVFLLVLAGGNLLAQKKAIFFQGESVFIGLPDCGVYTCPGGEPNTACYGIDTLMPCYSNFHMRDRVMVFDQSTEDMDVKLLFEGITTMIVNWNWRVDEIWDASSPPMIIYSGPMWATFTTVLDAGGTWEGTATGYWDGLGFTGTWDFVGHGTGGAVDGMQLKMTSSGGAFTPNDAQGRILRPGRP